MKIFGAALDALPHPEKVALKKAYIIALREGRVSETWPDDPYDALAPLLVRDAVACNADLAGKFPVASFLTPKPSTDDCDKIMSEIYFEFTDGGGCERLIQDLKKFVVEKIFPASPSIMIGADHILSAGHIMALSERLGGENLTVIVFDGHFDAISSGARQAAFESIYGKAAIQAREESCDSCTCETFLKYLIDGEFVQSKNLIVAGAYDFPQEKLRELKEDGIRLYCDEYIQYIDDGVTVLQRDTLRENPELFAERLDRIDTPYAYVSLDLDVAVSPENPAVRFHNSTGLTTGELIYLSEYISDRLRKGAFSLAGADVMEMDVHLLDVQSRDGIPNRTLETAALFLKTLLGIKAVPSAPGS